MITLVLLKDVKNLGKKGDIVTVKPGYARNYLLPLRLAKIAKEDDVKLHEKRQRFLEKTVKERDSLFAKIDEIIKSAIKKRGLMIRRAANNKGVLYDKVDKKELRDELMVLIPELEVFNVEVLLQEPLDKIGKHPVDILVKTENREKTITIIVDIVEASSQTKMKYSELKKQLKNKSSDKGANKDTNNK